MTDEKRKEIVERIWMSAKRMPLHWTPHHGLFCTELLRRGCLNKEHLVCAERYRREVGG